MNNYDSSCDNASSSAFLHTRDYSYIEDVRNTEEIIFYVEGATDLAFYNDHIKKKYKLNYIFQVPNRNYYNKGNKKNIITTLFLGKINEYGIVDKDFNDIDIDYKDLINKKLFLTDTHDLETLMFSTDIGLLSDKYNVNQELVNIAKYIAYQFAFIRSVKLKGIFFIDDINYFSAFINNKDFTIDLCKFIECSVNFNMKKYKEHLERKKQKDPNFKVSPSHLCKKREEYRSELEKLKYNLKTRDKFEINNSVAKFKIPLNGFLKKIKKNIELVKFWDMINGHDFCLLLKFLNPDLKKRFAPPERGLDRSFEFDLIEKYNYDLFKCTKLSDHLFNIEKQCEI